MMTAALGAARNILGEKNDLWAINTEPEYHEEKKESREPAYAEPATVDSASKLKPARPLSSTSAATAPTNASTRQTQPSSLS